MRDMNIRQHMQGLKTLVLISKKNGVNDKIPAGDALKNDVATDCNTKFVTVELFLLSIFDLFNVIYIANQNAPKSTNDAFGSTQCKNATYSSFSRLLTCLKTIRHAQTMLGKYLSPTPMLVLSVLEEWKHKILLLGNGVRRAPKYNILTTIDQELVIMTIEKNN